MIATDKPLHWMEADPLPDECINCREEDCYNCDYAGKRWYLSEEDELRIRKKGLLHTINRLSQRIEATKESDHELRQKYETDLAWFQQILLEDFGKKS